MTSINNPSFDPIQRAVETLANHLITLYNTAEKEEMAYIESLGEECAETAAELFLERMNSTREQARQIRRIVVSWTGPDGPNTSKLLGDSGSLNQGWGVIQQTCDDAIKEIAKLYDTSGGSVEESSMGARE
ncbi:hypothetical protein Micbo1qcDRAFT_179909 [Microdochium bolleyi]|uniref:Uncharacterized protein n=1 Tax=Microdochium bolleyi TaxID=196109 RepID=A0A136IN54_9PEZI|nr:hypothetical protein Micbo1qcDRAFT_179909 [Microdochium bolleyi]